MGKRKKLPVKIMLPNRIYQFIVIKVRYYAGLKYAYGLHVKNYPGQTEYLLKIPRQIAEEYAFPIKEMLPGTKWAIRYSEDFKRNSFGLTIYRL